MSDTDSAVTPPRPVKPRSRFRIGRWLAGTLITLVLLVVLLLGAGYVVLSSQAALDYVVQRAITESKGHLVIEDARGSLLSTFRVARMAWNGDGVDVEARDATLTWSPTDLLSRRFHVTGLGAKRLTLNFKPSPNSGSKLPASLALPLEVEVSNVGIERIEWQAGERQGFVSGVALNYSGGARQHAIRDLRIASEAGTLTGNAEIGATAPFPLSATLAVEGDGPYRDARAALRVAGTLERMDVDASGTMHDASLSAKALLTPFADAPVISADIDARGVDLARFNAALPSTLLAVKVDARPTANGFAGALAATNTNAGPIDRDRVPVESLSSRFAWENQTLTLSEIDARLPGGGAASGRIVLPLPGGSSEVALTLRGIDLARVQTSLLTTRLAGTVTAEVAEQKQTVRADLTQDDMALAFAAIVEGRRHVTVERFRAQAGGGELAGTGRIDLDGKRAFEVKARAARFDPSRFTKIGKGELNGTIDARGTLAPAWDVVANVSLDPGSRFEGLAVQGTARGHVTPTTARDIAIDARIGTTAFTLSGALGSPTDTLAFTLDAPQLAPLRPLLVRYAATNIPEAFGGALRARGTITGDRRSPGITLTAHGEALQWGALLRATTLDLDASVAPGMRGATAVALDARPITLKLTGKNVVTPQATVAALGVDITGTLAAHRASLEASGADFDFTATLAGGLQPARGAASGTIGQAWSGRIESFGNRGSYPVRLEAPAVLEVSPNRVHLGSARIAVADGRADIVDLVVDDGRITTRGSFTGIPANAIAKLTGTRLRVVTTVVLGGDWSIAATPRLNGSVTVRRERGDVFVAESVSIDPGDLALGITALEVTATFAEDAVNGRATFRSLRAGQADATLTLAAGPTPGRISTAAPFAATLQAKLASLQPLQPWLGTMAVIDGRANIDIAARGTLAEPDLTGTLTGDALRFDLPQYGVHLQNGQLRARLVERSLVLDDFSFSGGSGRFTAKGTLVRAGNDKGPVGAAEVTWQAENFTVVNRPDLRIVADGKGTLKLADGKLALAGSVNVDEGRIVYAPVTDGKLSDDVVIVGQPRKEASTSGMGDLPLTLDLEVKLGRDVRFSGEGLDTQLAGSVRVTTSAGGTLLAKGTITAVNGTYFVFGQRLEIERGRLLFDGPVSNPALDVMALRKNLAVEAGVEITGTVRVPRVRLVSNPPVSDAEKLSWLITGQGLDRATRSDIAVLSAASASLLGGGQKPLTTRLANRIGLDDISFRDTNTIPGGTSNQVVALTKRITDRLSIVYEQGLSFAANALRLEYSLSRSLTLRAEAGLVSNLGIFYRRSYD